MLAAGRTVVKVHAHWRVVFGALGIAKRGQVRASCCAHVVKRLTLLHVVRQAYLAESSQGVRARGI
jgi:hypothetical protein